MLRRIFRKRHSDRSGEEDFAVVEGNRRAQGAADGFGKADDTRRFALRQQDHRELVAGKARERILGLEQARKPSCNREQDGIADSHADGIIDLFKSIEVDHDNRWADLGVRTGVAECRFHAINEQFTVGQTGEVVVNRVKKQPVLGGLEIGHVCERADEPDNFAIGADHRARLQREPEVLAVAGSQPEILCQTTATLLDDAIEGGAETIAIERVQDFKPGRRRSFERTRASRPACARFPGWSRLCPPKRPNPRSDRRRR